MPRYSEDTADTVCPQDSADILSIVVHALVARLSEPLHLVRCFNLGVLVNVSRGQKQKIREKNEHHIGEVGGTLQATRM